MIQTWMAGAHLTTVAERRPWWLWRLGRGFGRLQARLHRLAPEELRREDEHAWAGDAGTLDDPALGALVEAVRASASSDVFCHFDFHPLNVLAVGRRITALLDFTGAALGDRRADLAYTQAVLLSAPLPPGPLSPVLSVLRRQFIASWRRGYEAEAGSRLFPLDPLFEAWGAAAWLAGADPAVAEGRGFASEQDMVPARAYLRDRMRAAGIEAAAT